MAGGSTGGWLSRVGDAVVQEARHRLDQQRRRPGRSAVEYSRLPAADSHAVDQFVGDEAVGLYFPLFTGSNHARPAVLAARELLCVMGYEGRQGPWLPIGVGIHTGVVFFGTVSGSEGSVTDVAALGDNVNITARLASKAAPGEALISNAAYNAAGLDLGDLDLEQRQLELKGKSELICVRVLRVSAC